MFALTRLVSECCKPPSFNDWCHFCYFCCSVANLHEKFLCSLFEERGYIETVFQYSTYVSSSSLLWWKDINIGSAEEWLFHYILKSKTSFSQLFPQQVNGSLSVLIFSNSANFQFAYIAQYSHFSSWLTVAKILITPLVLAALFLCMEVVTSTPLLEERANGF